MARLLVEAVGNEARSVDVVADILVYVSVSKADTGEPVTGLVKENFRICSSIGLAIDPAVSLVSESKWEPDDLAGCYSLWIYRGQGGQWAKGEFYAFGIQVNWRQKKRVKRNGKTHTEAILHQGQTVVSVESQGN
jgi:hypothetical protein